MIKLTNSFFFVSLKLKYFVKSNSIERWEIVYLFLCDITSQSGKTRRFIFINEERQITRNELIERILRKKKTVFG